MKEVLVTFQNKREPEFITPPTQVSNEFTVEEMEKFLNQIMNQDKSYAFFYKGEQILKLPEAQAEETINIEFIAVTKIVSESAKIEVNSPITCISIRRNPEVHSDSVIICTVEGTTTEYSLLPSLDKIQEFNSFKPIRAVTSTEKGVYVLTTTDKVVDIEEAKIVFELDKPIITISSCEDYLAIGLSTNQVVIMKNNEEIKRIQTSGEIGKLIFRMVEEVPTLIVGLVDGVIEIYTGPKKWTQKTIQLSRPITAMGYEDGKIYTGGIGGSIAVSTHDKLEKEYNSDVSFISRIECGTVFFGYTNENIAMLRDKDNFTGTHKIEMQSVITDMKISGKRLFIAEGETLKIFNILDE
ncbi:hypothetical protein NEOKW01_0530 [Nematocida sp. AWRm80]|nr:hypothetical protein NEOKW01_0530 [Nematocida sp. AWRm80]